MHLHSNFHTFSSFLPKTPENLWRIESVREVAIIKQQIESMCISEALLENAKIAGRKSSAARY
jgi:hypothetical protein